MCIAMRKRMVRRVALAMVLLAAVAQPGLVVADPVRPLSPTDTVRLHVDEIIDIATDTSLSPAARRDAVGLAVARTFDFVALSRRAFGDHWARLSAAQRDEVMAGLRDRVTAAFASPMAHGLNPGMERRGFIAHIRRLRTRVHYLGESISGHLASVTMSLTHAGRDLPLQVALIQQGRDWLVSDVAVDGVRLSDNLRAQIDHISRGADYAAVLDRLNAREQSAMTAPSAASGSPSR
jgi:ABC-type transporter MlaC component